MKLRTIGALCGSVLFAAIFSAAAQDAPALPKVLRVFREEVKQGKTAAHEKTEASFAKMLAKNKFPAYSLACNVVAGPPEAWFFEAHDSYMDVQKVDGLMEKNAALRTEFAMLDSLDGELRAGSSTMLARLRSDLSYRLDQFAQELPKTRYISMIIVRIRPYTDGRLAELGKQIIEADEKANNDMPAALYQVTSGAPMGTYLLFSPMKSLEAMDEAPARSRATVAAMGVEKLAAWFKGAGEIITNAQQMLLAVNPRMSYVSKAISDGDPDFWLPKAATTPKPAAPKAAEKSGAGQ